MSVFVGLSQETRLTLYWKSLLRFRLSSLVSGPAHHAPSRPPFDF